MARQYILGRFEGATCEGTIRTKRVTGAYGLRDAEAEGDYGARARGYGFLTLHCPHCDGGHAGMTCHWDKREV